MIILHTSDIHFGINDFRRGMEDNQRKFASFIRSAVIQTGASAILISGDIFDRSVSTVEAIRMYDDFINALSDLDVKILIIAGNHDGAERLAVCNKLLRKSGLDIAGSLSLPIHFAELNSNGERVLVYMLPFFSLEEARFWLADTSIKSYESAMQSLLSTIPPSDGVHRILMAHCFVRGSSTSTSDRAAVVGGSALVSSTIFKDFEYVALGHLHRPQNAGINVRYSGTPYQYSFAEEDQIKSITVLDTSNMSISEIAVPSTLCFKTIKGTLDEILSLPPSENFIRVYLSDYTNSPSITERMREHFPNLLQIIFTDSLNTSSFMSLEEISSLSPDELLKQFVKQMRNNSPDEEEISWFLEALSNMEDSD